MDFLRRVEGEASSVSGWVLGMLGEVGRGLSIWWSSSGTFCWRLDKDDMRSLRAPFKLKSVVHFSIYQQLSFL